mgnify:CR=1 FL=1
MRCAFGEHHNIDNTHVASIMPDSSEWSQVKNGLVT